MLSPPPRGATRPRGYLHAEMGPCLCLPWRQIHEWSALVSKSRKGPGEDSSMTTPHCSELRQTSFAAAARSSRACTVIDLVALLWIDKRCRQHLTPHILVGEPFCSSYTSLSFAFRTVLHIHLNVTGQASPQTTPLRHSQRLHHQPRRCQKHSTRPGLEAAGSLLKELSIVYQPAGRRAWSTVVLEVQRRTQSW